jgi:hypothetical protein
MNSCRTYPFHRLAVRSALIMLVLFSTAFQPATATESTPADLEAWSDWVLDDIKDFDCPLLYNTNKKHCSYPSRLDLDLASSSGTFTQSWSVYRESIIYLPGDQEHWPLNVSVDGNPVAVVSSAGHPAIKVEQGLHSVSGEFKWERLPESLLIPAESGLVTLRLEGRPVNQPDIRNGQLWLSDNEARPVTARRMDIKVFRKITDSIPLQVTTLIELEVSGEQREISLSGALPAGFEPVAVDSRAVAIVIPRARSSGALSI